ncbi:MAG TPA: protein kinase [Polyangiaceae bacterium]|nr:protein kinase [Polyangiaceae bacterium]
MSAPLPDELPPNFEFGGYVIRACIGRGGMARVYRAEQAALNRPVALKVLDRWVLEKPQGSQRFLREARAAASIKHPNVVDIVDVGVWQGRPYIVMELLGGSDLETQLAQCRVLSEGEVAALALPIIAGMMAVHEAGVIHRDLKPSNIFLSNGPDGEIVPKVLDFGVSKFHDAVEEPVRGQTKTREIIGTPTYMAPEALNGAREVGPRADQYALGAVLYECAVGRAPFEGETLLELLKAIAVGNVPAPRSIRPELSIQLEDAILRAMNGNPAARFDSLREFGRALWPLADERTKTIWARSFGSARPATLGGEPPSGLVLLAPDRPVEPDFRGSGRRWGTLRNLAGAVALVAGGIYVAPFVLRSPDPHVISQLSPPPRGVLPVEPVVHPSPVSTQPATQVEQHSLLAEPAPVERSGEIPVSDEEKPHGHGRDLTRVASATRSGGVRGNSKQAAARKRAPRVEPPPSSGDSELQGLFAAPESLPLRSADSDPPGELDGLFPNAEPITLGANGAPLPD